MASLLHLTRGVVTCGVALALAASVALAKDRAHGRDNVKYGFGIICDSAPQVERYLRLSNGDASLQDAVHIVNTESKNPKACGLAAIAFVADEQIGTVNIPNGVAHVMRIKVVGTATNKGWEPVPVTIQYTALMEKSVDI
jgi:hypothetical protein